LLVVLRLLAVYLAAATAALFAARKWVLPIGWRAGLFLVLTPFLVTGRAVLTGGVFAPIDISYQTDPLASEKKAAGIGEPKNASLGDVVYEEIPWRAAVREAIREGRAPLWNRFLLCGEPLLAMVLPAVLHPFTWIGMLLPLPQAWTLEMTLGVFLALMSAFLFFRDLGLSQLASAFGASAWAFCDYLRFYAGWPLSPAAAAFPLLLLGLSRIARDRDLRSFAVTAGALFLILNAGHPESALHAVAGGGIWFLFCLARRTWRNRVAAVAIAALAGLTVLALTAVVLLPHFEALRQTFEFWFRTEWWIHQKKSLPWRQALETFEQVVMPYAFGLPGSSGMSPGAQIPQAYLGALLLPFAAVGAASKRRERWPLLAIALVGFGAWSHAPVITDAISALPLFDLAINERLVFLGCFALAALGAFGMEEIWSRRSGRFLGVAIVAVACVLIAGFVLVRPRLIALEMRAGRGDAQLALQLVPLAGAGILIALFVRRSRRVRLAGAALLVLFLAERAAETEYLYPTAPSGAFYPPLRLLDPIPRWTPYRMASLGMGFLPNVATLYGVEDIRGYEAMTFKALFETFPLWSVHQPVWFNRIDDPTRPFLSFLNVRWVLAPPGMPAPAGWATVASARGGSLWENPRVVSRAFVPEEIWFEPEVGARVGVMETIDDFGRRGVVGAGFAGVSRRWLRNGRARVAISHYGAEKIALDVDASQPALVATSTTNWKGWHVFSEGNPLEIVEYNRAFVSFRVPAGRHRVEMLYRPRSVVVGAVISAFAAVAMLLFTVLRHVRKVRRTRDPAT
jgi:membrane protein YfhO